MPRSTYRDLVVWQQSMHLVREVYELCATLPSDERFGLSAQLKRAAVSVASNIGEGARRKRRLAFRYHLEVALGSQAEIEIQARSPNSSDSSTKRVIKRFSDESRLSGAC